MELCCCFDWISHNENLFKSCRLKQVLGMGNGEYGMENEEWRMWNGEWGMENEEWRMRNGEWGMGNGEWGRGMRNGKIKWEIENGK